ncbi:MAG: chemotaxis protein CheB, partial [Terrimicrobiaceae bacterium]
MTSGKKSRAGKSQPEKRKVENGETTGRTVFPIVGVGASAGGLAAFEAFFSGMPADKDPGMAFVLVQHLAPDHKSILAELIGRCTRMPVFEVEDGMVVRPNCTYVIPPGRDMAFLNGALHLLEPSEPHGRRLPIDFFFRSLASDQHERAVGIVLSGTGSDGTQGVHAIKGEGGMVMAQSNSPTGFDGMPHSAIATGLVDYELPPAGMPAQLLAYAAHPSGRLPRKDALSSLPIESAIKKIFILLRDRTGHDFSQYKPGTIHRRIERRMAMQQIEALDSYVRYLQQTPDEVETLFRDLLIGVTHFFRDPEAFQALREQVIPKLFDNRHAGSAVRVWVTGCSTGEEAYSIAILLVEHMETLKRSFPVHVFATDIDGRAIARARTGLYPASIASHVSPERLARFFTAEADGSVYRIHKGIRDLLVFSEQDVIKDPPFSKLDLIACRNLLIYMSPALQKKLIPLFHYAMKPGGWLFLGTSEGVGEFGELFAVLDRKAKLYEWREDLHRLPHADRPLGPIVPLLKVDKGAAGAAAKPAITARQPVHVLPIHPETAGPAESSEPPSRPVIPQESASSVSRPELPDAETRIAALERELQAKKEDFENTREELESSTEELKSSVEEMQSVNEELQSTNEELETSKEELQSVN